MSDGALEPDAAHHTQNTTAHDTTAWNTTARIDTARPNPARVYDVFLGGKDNYPADRIAAKAALAANPRGYLNVWHNRDFVRRAVRHLAADAGIRQFLDIGTGLPTVENVHEIAQRITPRSRIVYVDNDPVVLAHARALLTSHPEGTADYLDADLRDPDRILEKARRTLDLGWPVALVLAAVLHFVDDQAAYKSVSGLVSALAPGSYLILSHLTIDLNPENGTRAAKAYADSGSPASPAVPAGRGGQGLRGQRAGLRAALQARHPALRHPQRPRTRRAGHRPRAPLATGPPPLGAQHSPGDRGRPAEQARRYREDQISRHQRRDRRGHQRLRAPRAQALNRHGDRRRSTTSPRPHAPPYGRGSAS